MRDLMGPYRLDIQHQRAVLKDLLKYLQEERVDVSDDDLFDWWIPLLMGYPVLAKVVLSLLSIPVSSATVEGSFSSFKYVLRDNRKRMKSDTIEKVQMLNYNKAV